VKTSNLTVYEDYGFRFQGRVFRKKPGVSNGYLEVPKNKLSKGTAMTSYFYLHSLRSRLAYSSIEMERDSIFLRNVARYKPEDRTLHWHFISAFVWMANIALNTFRQLTQRGRHIIYIYIYMDFGPQGQSFLRISQFIHHTTTFTLIIDGQTGRGHNTSAANTTRDRSGSLDIRNDPSTVGKPSDMHNQEKRRPFTI
jgi:hypothetical protein